MWESYSNTSKTKMFPIKMKMVSIKSRFYSRLLACPDAEAQTIHRPGNLGLQVFAVGQWLDPETFSTI